MFTSGAHLRLLQRLDGALGIADIESSDAFVLRYWNRVARRMGTRAMQQRALEIAAYDLRARIVSSDALDAWSSVRDDSIRATACVIALSRAELTRETQAELLRRWRMEVAESQSNLVSAILIMKLPREIDRATTLISLMPLLETVDIVATDRFLIDNVGRVRLRNILLIIKHDDYCDRNTKQRASDWYTRLQASVSGGR